MKHQNYYDRALKASDRRYARVFEKMGYGTRDMRAVEPVENHDDIAILRAEYKVKLGKKPFMGWSADKLREKIVEAESDE